MGLLTINSTGLLPGIKRTGFATIAESRCYCHPVHARASTSNSHQLLQACPTGDDPLTSSVKENVECSNRGPPNTCSKPRTVITKIVNLVQYFRQKIKVIASDITSVIDAGVCDITTGRCKCFPGYCSSGASIDKPGTTGDCSYRSSDCWYLIEWSRKSWRVGFFESDWWTDTQYYT